MNILESVLFVLVFPFLSFARKYNAFCESYFGGGRAATFFYVCSFPILVLCVYAFTVYVTGRVISCIIAKVRARKRFLVKGAHGTIGEIHAILNGMIADERGELSGGMNRSEFWRLLRDIDPESIASVCSTITFLICEGLHPLSGCPL